MASASLLCQLPDGVPVAACEQLAEDAAQTTLMVVEFQRWYVRQSVQR